MRNPLDFISFRTVELVGFVLILVALFVVAFSLGSCYGEKTADYPDPVEVIRLKEAGAAPLSPDERPQLPDLPADLREGSRAILDAEQELPSKTKAEIIGDVDPAEKPAFAEIRLTPDNLGGRVHPHVFERDGWWYVRTDVTVWADLENGKQLSRGPLPADVTRVARVAPEVMPLPAKLPREFVGIVRFPVAWDPPSVDVIYYPREKWWGVGAGYDFNQKAAEVLFSARWHPG